MTGGVWASPATLVHPPVRQTCSAAPPHPPVIHTVTRQPMPMPYPGPVLACPCPLAFAAEYAHPRLTTHPAYIQAAHRRLQQLTKQVVREYALHSLLILLCDRRDGAAGNLRR